MPIELTSALAELKSGFDLLRSAIGLAKDTKDLVGSTATQEAIIHSLDEAERASHLAEAQIAQALGYKLCQCTFPPQIMLSIGRHRDKIEQFQCPGCQKKEPSNPQLQSRDAVDRRNRGGSWMSA